MRWALVFFRPTDADAERLVTTCREVLASCTATTTHGNYCALLLEPDTTPSASAAASETKSVSLVATTLWQYQSQRLIAACLATLAAPGVAAASKAAVSSVLHQLSTTLFDVTQWGGLAASAAASLDTTLPELRRQTFRRLVASQVQHTHSNHIMNATHTHRLLCYQNKQDTLPALFDQGFTSAAGFLASNSGATSIDVAAMFQPLADSLGVRAAISIATTALAIGTTSLHEVTASARPLTHH